MAITEIPEYAHLSDADIEALAAELDEIRCDIEDSLGTKDREYIRRAVAFQRCFEIAARLIAGTKTRSGWMLGTPRWPRPNASRTWNSPTTSSMVSGIG